MRPRAPLLTTVLRDLWYLLGLFLWKPAAKGTGKDAKDPNLDHEPYSPQLLQRPQAKIFHLPKGAASTYLSVHRHPIHKNRLPLCL